MKATKTKKNEEAMPGMVVMVNRLVENGVVYLKGNVIIEDTIEHDRLVFLLAKEWLYPVGAWQALPEPLFTDVMEMRD